jgi:dienelactone hydrolase
MSRRIVLVITLVLLPLASRAVGQENKGEPTPKKIVTPYPIDHAKPLEAKEEIVGKEDDHTLFRVEFRGSKDDRVPANLFIPKRKNDAPPCPAVLLQFGSGGNRKVDYIVAIGKQFVARGFVVITIDSPGAGERRTKETKSEGPLGLISPQTMFHYCSDYSRAVDYLVTRPEVDTERVGYVGISWGAITGITYAAYDDRIKAVGSMVGGGNFVGLYNGKLAEKIAKEGSKSSDPVYHVARISPRPLMFINVTKDEMILKSWAESLHKAAGPGAKVVWLDTNHTFSTVDRNKVCDSVIDFLEKEMPVKKVEKK